MHTVVFQQRMGFVKWFVACGGSQPALIPLADQPTELGLSLLTAFCPAFRKTLFTAFRKTLLPTFCSLSFL